MNIDENYIEGHIINDELVEGNQPRNTRKQIDIFGGISLINSFTNVISDAMCK